MPLMRQAFSSGTAINYLFRLIKPYHSHKLLGHDFLSGKMRFWKMDMLRESAEGMRPLPGKIRRKMKNAVRGKL